MNNLRVVATLIIVVVIALLSVFQMQIRGYEKVGRIEEWVLYIENQDEFDCVDEKIYEDDDFTYYLSCGSSDNYLVKSGFEERELIYALDEGLITISELEELISLVIVEK